MAFPEFCNPGSSFLLQVVCLLSLSTAIAGSPPVEVGFRSNFSEHEYQNLNVSSAHHYPRRGAWATSSRHIRSPPTFDEALLSIFKNADYGDNTILVVCQDGTAQYSSVQDAVDHVPENNTRRTTIYVTSGVYE